jgi:hypothetical protein
MACLRASVQFKSGFKGPVQPSEFVRLISSSMFTQLAQSQAVNSISRWHQRQLSQNRETLSEVKLSSTCLSCIRRRPQFGLPCGHLICENCVRTFYNPSENDPWEYQLEICLICGQYTSKHSVRLTPETCRLHVLSIDGGGIRGSGPIGFLKEIQDEIGIPYYNVRDSFDVKFGTSSGRIDFPFLIIS